MRKNKTTPMYNTPYQLKLPPEIEKIIEIFDPVYTFCEVLNQIDLKRYLVVKENRTGQKRFDSETLLKVILFGFMEHGYVLVREIDNFMNHCLTDSIEKQKVLNISPTKLMVSPLALLCCPKL